MSLARESELELKLELTRDELRRVRSHPALGDLAVGEPVTRTVRSIYFDTPDHRLRALGISLRSEIGRRELEADRQGGHRRRARRVEPHRGGDGRRAAGARSRPHRQPQDPPQGREGRGAFDPGAGVRDGGGAHHASAAFRRRRAGACARRGHGARRRRRERAVRGRAGAEIGRTRMPARDGGQAVRQRAGALLREQQGRARLQPGARPDATVTPTSSRSAACCPSFMPSRPAPRRSGSSCARPPTRSWPTAAPCWRRSTRRPRTSCASACGACAARCAPSARCTTRPRCASWRGTPRPWRARSASCAMPTC